MSVSTFLAQLKRLDIQIRVENEKLRISAPKGAISKDLKEAIAAQKTEIISFLNDARRNSGQDLPAIRRINRDETIPLSFAQNRMWFLYQLAPSGSYYNMPSAFVLKGEIDISIVDKVLLEIVRRHEILRTVYRENNGRTEQVICDVPSRILEKEDLIHIEGHEQELLLRERIREEWSKPFDLTKDAMLRAKVLRIEREEHVIVFNMHHIASDGWSYGVILKEFSLLYEAFSKGEESELLDLEYQYVDYAAWQRELLSKEKIELHLSYWRQQLEGIVDLELPVDRRRSQNRTREGGVCGFEIDGITSDNVSHFSKKNGMTPFMVILGVYQILLARYTGQTDFCVGTPVAGRPTTELEKLVGFFVNSLPLRVHFDEKTSFGEFMHQVKKTCLDAFSHQDMPFDILVENLRIDRDLTRNPVFQTMFSFRAVGKKNISLPNLAITRLESSIGQAKFELLLTVTETKRGLHCSFEYDADLFKKDTVQRLAESFASLLRSAVSSPEQKIGLLPIMTEEEQRTVLRKWNSTAVEYPRDSSIHEIFTRVVEARGTETALELDKEVLSYRQLEERSNQLAHYLIAKGVLVGSLVGLCLERSFEAIVGLLAILKTGCAYVPLDPDYPKQRLEFMLRDTKLRTIVSQSSFIEYFPNERDMQLICLDEDAIKIGECSADPPDNHRGKPNTLAYVMYTSGSTGNPKGVAITHRNVVRTAISPNYCILDEKQILFHYAPLAFDASTFEIWGAILNGARLIICPPGPKSLEEIAEQVRKHGVTTLFLTSGLFHKMVDENVECFAGVDQLMSGGDALSRNRVERTLSDNPNLRIINAYGPTENTVVTACCNFSKPSELTNQVPIGRPVSNARIYILDSDLNPVPIGAIGELYTSGDGVARCYLNRPSLTAERFIPNPFVNSPGDRMYRTGDLARWLPDGRIEFYGRMDNQVKIRGHRIELGEIENHLSKNPHVRECAVTALDDGYGDKRLVGYVVTDGSEVSASELQSGLKQSLPEYMVPAIFVNLDSLPLTVSGKMNRKALPKPDLDAIAAVEEFVEPATETEKRLAEIWKGILKIGNVSANTDFFSIGGHSLTATQVVSHIREQLGLEITLVEFFENSRISQLAKIIDKKTPLACEVPLKPVEPRDFYPCTSAQKRMYILNKIDDQGVSYNVPLLARMKGKLDSNRFQEVFSMLAERHDAMRTRFGIRGNELVQYLDDSVEASVEFGRSEQKEIDEEIRSLIRPFDVNTSPLWRATVLQLSEEEFVLVIDAHHIVLDGLSLVGLLKEFCALYAGQKPPKPKLQPKDFAVWQNEEYLPSFGQEDEKYWLSVLGGDLPSLRLPLDHPRPAVQSFRGGNHRFSLHRDLSKALRAWAGANKSTLFFTLLGVYKILLHKYTGGEDIIVGIPVSGRPHHDLEGTVGMFVNTLALRSFPSPTIQASEFLGSVKKSALEAFEHQLFPYEDLLDQLDLTRDTSRNPLFDTMFSMIDLDVKNIEMEGLLLEPYPMEKGVSKFDLSLSARESEEGIVLNFEYCRDLFEPETIERLGTSFVLLCQELCGNPLQTIREMGFLPDEDIRLLLQEFARNPAEIDRSRNYIELFLSTVEKHRTAVAIIEQERKLRYDEIDFKSTKLARHLRELGAEPGDHIAVVLPRSASAVIIFLAILKARCVYVPIDPFSPMGRKTLVIEDCDAALVLCKSIEDRQMLGDSLPPSLKPKILVAGEELESETELAQLPDLPRARLSQDDIAYVIYTSGSSGKPKGVRISHGNLAHYVQAYIKFLEIRESDVVAHLSSLAFDASVEEIAVPLVAGGTIAIFPQEKLFDIDVFVKNLRDQNVTVAAPTPLLLSELARKGPFPSARMFLSGGDKLKTDHLHNLRESATVWNLYGPTETTISACGYKLPADDEENIPIGRPFPNYELYVLDKDLDLRPVGVPGQLYIAGPGVAVGYLNRDELTAERFVSNPFRPGERMYATGDLVKWRQDGSLLYLGRVDRQVQIRGFRVELGEIESAIDALSRVDGSLVIDREDASGVKFLVCYYTTADKLPLQNPRGEIEDHLPSYMIPQHFVHIEEFPKNVSGKIDIRKLPDFRSSDFSKGKAILPRTAVEKKIYALWKNVLDIDALNIDDNFFDVGGNSLRLAQLHEAVNSEFNCHVRLIELFNNSTIEKMSRLLQSTTKAAVKKTLPANIMPREFFCSTSTRMVHPRTLKAQMKDIDLSSFISQPNQKKFSIIPAHLHLGVVLHLIREYNGSQISSAHYLASNNELISVEIDLSKAEDFPGLFALIAQEQQLNALDHIGLIRGEEVNSFRPLFTAMYKVEIDYSKLLRIFDIIISVDHFESPNEIHCTYNEHDLIGEKIKSFVSNYIQFLRMLVDEHEERSE